MVPHRGRTIRIYRAGDRNRGIPIHNIYIITYVNVHLNICIIICICTFIFIVLHIYGKRVLIRNWLIHYGGWEFPWAAVCRLDIQQSWWWNSVQVWRPETRSMKGRRQMFQSCSQTDNTILPSLLILFFFLMNDHFNFNIWEVNFFGMSLQMSITDVV